VQYERLDSGIRCAIMSSAQYGRSIEVLQGDRSLSLNDATLLIDCRLVGRQQCRELCQLTSPLSYPCPESIISLKV
jgi:hypothetical protein